MKKKRCHLIPYPVSHLLVKLATYFLSFGQWCFTLRYILVLSTLFVLNGTINLVNSDLPWSEIQHKIPITLESSREGLLDVIIFNSTHTIVIQWIFPNITHIISSFHYIFFEKTLSQQKKLCYSNNIIIRDNVSGVIFGETLNIYFIQYPLTSYSSSLYHFWILSNCVQQRTLFLNPLTSNQFIN